MKALILSLVLGGLILASSAAEPENRVVFDILTSPEHPRNSESSFVTLKSGRILGLYGQFSGGASDFSVARIAQIHSDDRGRTWSQPEAFMERGGYLHVSSPSLLRLASGKIALFYAAKKGGLDCHPLLRLSSDEGASWSADRPVIAAPGYFVLNNDRVIQTTTGRLIVAVAYNRALKAVDHGANSSDVRGIILWHYSDDEGATWHEASTWWAMPVPSISGLQEPGLVELADGSLFSFARSNLGQFGFRSHDAGVSWSPPQATELISPASPASIKRLPDSNALLAIHFVDDAVLLAYNDSIVKGPHLANLRIRRIARSWLPAP